MGIDFGGLDVTMTELFLHGTDIRTRFEQVGCERVPQPVTGYVLFDSRIKGSLFYRAVDFGFIDVMAPQLITIPIIFCNNRATSNRVSTTGKFRGRLARLNSPRLPSGQRIQRDLLG